MAKNKTVKKTKAQSKSKVQKVAAVAKKVARPWQGSAMAILAVIEAAATLVFGVFFLVKGGFSNEFISGMMPMVEMPNGSLVQEVVSRVFTEMGILLAFFFLAAGVLDIFIARGLFYGKFWAVMLVSFFVGLAFLTAIFEVFFVDNRIYLSSLTGLAFVGFIVYLCYSCWMSPFYRK